MEYQDDLLRLLVNANKDTRRQRFRESLESVVSPDVCAFIEAHSPQEPGACIAILKTSDDFNVKSFPDCSAESPDYELMVNLKPINDTLRINDLFVSFQNKLRSDGLFVGCVETYQLRKRRLLKKYPPILNYFYYSLDYLFKRVFPKIKFLDKIYFFITAGRNRAISDTEAIGRLHYCGFEVLDTFIDGKLMYFAAQKKLDITQVQVEEKHYGVILKLPRKGKNGNVFSVYKLRTMFPYAEYVQEYIYKQNQLKEGGKFENDYRISLLGRNLRKYFIDEIPMIINLLKGDMKLVGVRPLSKQYFSLYDKELQEQRLKHKPGLIPPFYADMPKTLEEIQKSEKNYLDAHEKSPLRTDIKYLWLAFKNIVFNRARSN